MKLNDKLVQEVAEAMDDTMTQLGLNPELVPAAPETGDRRTQKEVLAEIAVKAVARNLHSKQIEGDPFRGGYFDDAADYIEGR